MKATVEPVSVNEGLRTIEKEGGGVLSVKYYTAAMIVEMVGKQARQPRRRSPELHQLATTIHEITTRASTDEPVYCGACETVFKGDNIPVGFALMGSGIEGSAHLIATAFCAKCAANPNAAIKRAVGAFMPEPRILPPAAPAGHA